MKKALVLGLVVLLVIGLAVAIYGRDKKVDLINFTPPEEVVGFVIFNTSHLAAEGYRLTVLVSLKQGKSEVLYSVEVRAESPGSEDDIFLAGEFTTNHRGHGNLQLKSGPGDVLSRGRCSFEVLVWAIEGDNRIFVAYSDFHLK